MIYIIVQLISHNWEHYSTLRGTAQRHWSHSSSTARCCASTTNGMECFTIDAPLLPSQVAFVQFYETVSDAHNSESESSLGLPFILYYTTYFLLFLLAFHLIFLSLSLPLLLLLLLLLLLWSMVRAFQLALNLCTRSQLLHLCFSEQWQGYCCGCLRSISHHPRGGGPMGCHI